MKRFVLQAFLAAFVLLAHNTVGAEPLSLDEAIRTALAQGGAVRVTSLDRQISQAKVTSAWGTFDPSIRLERSQTDDETPLSLAALADKRRTDIYQAGVVGYTPWGLSYTLSATALNERGLASGSNVSSTGATWKINQPLLKGFGFGPALAPLRLAKADQRMADAEFKRIVIQTVTDVIVAYQDLLEARDVLRISTAYRDNVAGLAADNQRRFEVGSLAEADVANAKSKAAQVEESIIYYNAAARTAENRLRRLLGEADFSTTVPLELSPLPALTVPEVRPAADLSTALAARPELALAREGVRKGEIRRSVARNQLLPQVDLVLGQGYHGLDDSYQGSRSQISDRLYKSTTAGVVVEIPLAHSSARGELRAARLSHLRAQTEQQELEADIAVELTNAATLLQAAGERVETLRRAHTHASRSLEAEVKRLRAGTGQTFFVLQQQGELAQVETALTRALADQRRAAIRYEQARGTTLNSLGLSVP